MAAASSGSGGNGGSVNGTGVVNEAAVDDRVEDMVVRLAAGEQVHGSKVAAVAAAAGLEVEDIRAMAAVREIDAIDARRRENESGAADRYTQRMAEVRKTETARDAALAEADARVETARQMAVAAGLGLEGVWGATPDEIMRKLEDACRLSNQSKSRLIERKRHVLRRLDAQIAAADATARRMAQMRSMVATEMERAKMEAARTVG